MADPRWLIRIAARSALVLFMVFYQSPLLAGGEQQSSRRSTPAVDPEADELLKRSCKALAAARSFTFDAHAVIEQVLENGQKVEFARNSKFAVRRPDRVAVRTLGDVEDLGFYYDGKSITLFNRKTNSYGTCDAKATIEATADLLADTYGFVLPLVDLLFSDPYKTLVANVRSGRSLGIGYVFDTKCHHVAFRQEGVDWQVWIDEDREKPLPRKIVITYKETPAQLQYTAYLSDWNLAADLPDSTFTFAPPPGAKKVDFARPAPPRAEPRNP